MMSSRRILISTWTTSKWSITQRPLWRHNIVLSSAKHVEVSRELKSGELVASWTVGIGDQDQVIHMWKYTGGYTGVDAAKLAMRENPVRFRRDKEG